MKDEKIVSLEYLRISALISVILIHFNAKGFFSYLPGLGFSLDTLSRFAVPLFFFISGYLLKKKHLNHPNSYLIHSFKRLILPYGLWFLLYNWHYLTHDVKLESAKSLQKFAYHLFLKGGAGYHLWFLPALFVGGNIVVLLFKLPFLISFSASLSLYLAGVSISHFTDLPNWVSRSGFFFAPVFFHLGILAKDSSLAILLKRYGVLLLFAGAALHSIESYFFAKDIQFGLNLGIGLIFYTLGVFGSITRFLEKQSPIADLGKYVFGAYLLHVSFIYGFQWLNLAPSPGITVMLLLFTFCSSLAVSAILSRIPYLRRLVL